jgi:hypothetical protein
MSKTKTEAKYNQELIKIYGRSEKGNFGVVDTMPEKHAYCIGAKHVGFAADHFSGMLSEECIREGEKQGKFHCETCESAYRRRDTDTVMDFDEHLSGLLIECLQKPSDEKGNEYGKELKTYMKKIIEMKHFKDHYYVGFVLLDMFAKKND